MEGGPIIGHYSSMVTFFSHARYMSGQSSWKIGVKLK